jgi:hypothetical protein
MIKQTVENTIANVKKQMVREMGYALKEAMDKSPSPPNRMMAHHAHDVLANKARYDMIWPLPSMVHKMWVLPFKLKKT